MTQKIIVALDTSNLNGAKKLVKTLWPRVKFFKIGLEMINTGQAPELIRFIKKLGGRVFYDVKLNDIPNTVAKTSKVISGLGIDMFTVHASAGREAIRAAIRNKGRSKVIGVTVLTSLGDNVCKVIFGDMPSKKVMQLTDMLLKEGADGIVCSYAEAKLIRKFKRFKKLKIIIPGIRPSWASQNEQKRTATPREAIESGADYLVIGRPVTDPPKKIGSPSTALDIIIKELQ
ncbi:MAG: orotidine-5'-phosphate decarboxylase [Candidatus Taylorbacteria bacterium]|nr:orotidine-5'-phosphate decarboxylase [Candidatus Taylorbacteria bacterium]